MVHYKYDEQASLVHYERETETAYPLLVGALSYKGVTGTLWASSETAGGGLSTSSASPQLSYTWHRHRRDTMSKQCETAGA